LRVGVHFGHAVADAPLLVETARWADELGYDSYWLVDPAEGLDPFAALAAAAGATRRLRLGTGVASIFHHPPLSLATNARTIDDLSGGRMLLGLGTSHPEIIAQVGVAWRKPFTAMQEAMAITRGLLDGEAVDVRGEHFRVSTRLQPSPRRRLPIVVGAIRPRMLRFAGATADGVLLNHVVPSYVPRLVEEIRRGAAEAGRPPEAVEIVCSVPTYVGEDAEDVQRARETRRAMLVRYIGLEIYRRRYAAMGFGAEMDAIAAALGRGEPAAALVPDTMVAQMVNAGSAGECRAVMSQYGATGVDTYLVLPIYPPGDTGPLRRTLEALAPAA
jgi:alkanesulfonate monooxygenase SsuD/methylene tetrahydromethanopterin reductase-like flavin-dependent oxidoreductase (luciferase family)